MSITFCLSKPAKCHIFKQHILYYNNVHNDLDKSTEQWSPGTFQIDPYSYSNGHLVFQRRSSLLLSFLLGLLHGVPMELFTREGLAHIASAVRVPLYFEKFTEQCRQIDIVKICVEVQWDDLLPSSKGRG